MKFLKGISLFFIYPVMMFSLGVFVGVKTTHFFYPGSGIVKEKMVENSSDEDWAGQIVKELENSEGAVEPKEGSVPGQFAYMQENVEKENLFAEPQNQEEMLQQVSSPAGILDVDTEYVLEETDIVSHTVVEIVGRLPSKYIGMNREQFLEAMKEYEQYPPLSEMERGFVGLEVLSFSEERVVLQMNYQYIQPSNSFYLTVQDNEVVVYLEDKKTIYINTGILLDTLPEEMQLKIIEMLWIENEESLYNFLETYSS